MPSNKRIYTFAVLMGLLVGSATTRLVSSEISNPPLVSAAVVMIAPTPEPIVQVFPKVTKKAVVTAYSCAELETDAQIRLNCPSLLTGGPKTANGSVPIAYKTMACDKANMGKTFWLDIDGGIEVVCNDTGGSINGAGRFDLYLPTYKSAIEFGRQSVEYYQL